MSAARKVPDVTAPRVQDGRLEGSNTQAPCGAVLGCSKNGEMGEVRRSARMQHS